jgi:hypothetical protein
MGTLESHHSKNGANSIAYKRIRAPGFYSYDPYFSKSVFRISIPVAEVGSSDVIYWLCTNLGDPGELLNFSRTLQSALVSPIEHASGATSKLAVLRPSPAHPTPLL